MKLNVELQPKQLELLRLVEDTDYRMIGYGGSNGGGKSEGVRSINLILCMKLKKQPVRTLIFRRKSNDLLENHIIPFFQRYPELDKYFNKTERIIYWPDGSTTKFGSADIESDIYDFEGKEYDYIFVDEATLCTQMMIEFLKSRNRSANVKAKMIFTMIPGFIGHNYLKRLFITKQYLDYEMPTDYTYLPAKIWDNVVWVENKLMLDGYTVDQYYREWTEDRRMQYTLQYSDYAQTLKHLPEQKKRGRLFGDWYVFEGQFFENWNPEVHVIKPKNYLSESQLKQMDVLGGLDYGGITSLHFGAKDYNGNIVIFDELHLEKVSRTEKIKSTKAFLLARGLERVTIIADTNMWLPDQFDSATLNDAASEYIEAGINLKIVSKRSPDNRRYRVACNDTISNLLEHDINPANGLIVRQPKLKIYERCRYLIETMPALVRSDKDVEDIADNQDDHDFDSAKYLIMSLISPAEQKTDTRPGWLRKLDEENSKIDFMSV
jgi:phage terminase large subunit